MKVIRLVFACIALAVSAIESSAQSSIISWDFSSDAQGWSVADLVYQQTYVSSVGTYAVTHNASGGDPGGYICASDPSPNVYVFDAPTASLGDWSRFVGGTLTFSLQGTHSQWQETPWVFLVSGTTVLVHTIAAPSTTWSTRQVSLRASSFTYVDGTAVTRHAFAAVMSSLDALRINAEWSDQPIETTALDSVLVSTAKAVPATSIWGAAFACAAVAALGVLLLMRR